jgi:predicted 2-oxoglutarate/Fe(II)-dependent dioxygenase YbiX
MTIIMNSKLFHKVNPVSDGVRYSLITFFQTKQKRSKSII